MQSDDTQKGRRLLVTVTLLAVALQALKLASRGLLLHQWPTAGQWGQLGLVAWLLFSLWEGKPWARVACAAYYSFATVTGAAILYLMWSKADVALRLVSLLIVILAGFVSVVLWFSGALRWYLAERLTAAE